MPTYTEPELVAKIQRRHPDLSPDEAAEAASRYMARKAAAPAVPRAVPTVAPARAPNRTPAAAPTPVPVPSESTRAAPAAPRPARPGAEGSPALVRRTEQETPDAAERFARAYAQQTFTGPDPIVATAADAARLRAEEAALVGGIAWRGAKALGRGIARVGETYMEAAHAADERQRAWEQRQEEARHPTLRHTAPARAPSAPPSLATVSAMADTERARSAERAARSRPPRPAEDFVVFGPPRPPEVMLGPERPPSASADRAFLEALGYDTTGGTDEEIARAAATLRAR